MLQQKDRQKALHLVHIQREHSFQQAPAVPAGDERPEASYSLNQNHGNAA